ncbi:MAG TPA: M20/M25/M40 family metallo-hydrolase [Bryobacterales bacterium]|nr:M20/M25/M40 family metallo-hydrolase [Bryobacterales bacterium]
MNLRLTRRWACAAVLGLLLWAALRPAPAAAQDGATPAGRLTEEIAQTPSLEKNLRVLCDEIGGRLPGTPAMRRAIAWGVNAFHEAGLEQVHTESFTIPNSWSEGATRVEVLAPVQFTLHAAASGWAGATPEGGIEADVVSGGRGEDGDVARLGESAKGKIVLIRSDSIGTFQDMAVEQRRFTVAIREAEKVRAGAVLLMSTRPRGLLYRHTDVADGRIDPMPSAVVAREDGQRIQRLLDAGEKVRMRVALPNKIGGPFESQNVVAEIRGREKPQEVVIIGAHLDSWDLGTGCLDNGCNAALVIEVARAIQAMHPHPRRTVRFILFSGEEEGLLGSWAYVRQHRSELDNIVAVLVHDIGVGRITGYSLGGRSEMEAPLSEAMAPIASRGANTDTTDAFFGTDHFDFLLEGIPTLVANQDTTDYVPNYHAQSDTFDKVDLTELRNQAGIAAVVVYNIAERPKRLAKRQNREEVEKLMRDTRLDEQLKFLGLWDEWTSGERGRQPGPGPLHHAATQ